MKSGEGHCLPIGPPLALTTLLTVYVKAWEVHLDPFPFPFLVRQHLFMRVARSILNCERPFVISYPFNAQPSKGVRSF
jgi:hypothetical protein